MTAGPPHTTTGDTLRITLAYSHDGHAAGKTIEVDDDVGRQLIHDGRAVRSDEQPTKTTHGKKEA